MRKFGIICGLIVLAAWAPARAQGRQQLHGHVPAETAAMPFVGVLDGSTPLRLVITLPLRHPEELNGFLKQVNDPHNPLYRHYLTPRQFAEQYGPSEADYAAVSAFAQSKNLTVLSTSPNRVLLEVGGSAGDVQKAFYVSLGRYRRPDGTEVFAPQNEPSADLDTPLLHIGGLDNLQKPQPSSHVKAFHVWSPAPPAPGAQPAAANTSTPTPVPMTGSAPSGLFWGKDFRNAYVPGVCLTGTGQSVALVEFEGYFSQDITGYESLAGLPSVTLTNVPVSGFRRTSSDSNGIIECSLDIEMSISMAPGLSQVLVYEADNTGATADPLLNQIATDDKASQISCSWTGFGDAATTVIFQEFAAQGQSFFQAAGDYGAYVSGDPTPTVPAPINLYDSIQMTVVGGTELLMSGGGQAYLSETAWNAPLSGTTYAGGGGVCNLLSLPSYQQSLGTVANGGSTVNRNIPDVSMNADNDFVTADKSYTSNTSYSYYTVVGTSAATPLWAGFMALANQQAASGGVSAVGFANLKLYPAGQGGNYGTDFHDVTAGNNNLNGNPAQYSAVPGYDLATGWGSPAGQGLINDLTGVTGFPCTSTATPSSTPTATFTSTFTRTATGTPTPTASRTPTATASSTPTGTVTSTASATPTPSASATSTASSTPSKTPTNTSTATPTNTPTLTPANTATLTPSSTPSPTTTPSQTPSPSATATGDPSVTPSLTPSSTASFTPTDSTTASPTVSNTPTASFTMSWTPSLTPSASPSATPALTATASGTPTSTETSTTTGTPTATLTATASATASFTPTRTPTATPSATPTGTATATSTFTGTATPTGTPTPTASGTPSPTTTPTSTSTDTASFTPTSTFTATDSPTLTPTTTATSTASATSTPSATGTSTPTPTATSTATATWTASNTPTDTGTPTATLTPSRTPTSTATGSATSTPSSTATSTGSATPTSTFTASATATATGSASSTATSTASLTPSSTPTSTPSLTPTPTPSGTATATNTSSWTATSTGTSTPSRTTTATPSFTPSPTASFSPTDSMTASPTVSNTPTASFTMSWTPSLTPSASPTPTASATPTETASLTPTSTPSLTPSATPSATSSPTASATPSATSTASHTPTHTSTFTPSSTPSPTPSFTPASTPTASASPTASSTASPPVTPTFTPSNLSTFTPTVTPTPGITAAWVVYPNISRNGALLHFEVTLSSPSPITLGLYDLAGELVYEANVQGNAGANVITWNLENQAGQRVASGLYLYMMNIPGFPGTQPHGKVLILH